MGTWSTATMMSVAALLLALPAAAQGIGTPGNGPLYPGGPRQGLGPPSITDSVPDLRLHSEAGGIPGAGPPIDYGGSNTRSYGYPQRLRDPGVGAAYETRRGRHCQTARRVCVLTSAAPVGTGCSCRTPNAGRARGSVVR